MTHDETMALLSPQGPVISIMRDEEREYLWNICQNLPLGCVVEVGASHGGTTLLLHQATNRPIHVVENWISRRREDFLANAEKYNTKYIEYPEGSPAAAKNFAPNTCALILIDGEHENNAPKIDLLTWINKVKTGGYLLVDDVACGLPKVTKAVLEMHRELTLYELDWCHEYDDNDLRGIKLVSYKRN